MTPHWEKLGPPPHSPRFTKPSAQDDRDHWQSIVQSEAKSSGLSDHARDRLFFQRIGKRRFQDMDVRELKRAFRALKERNGRSENRAPRVRPAPQRGKIRALWWTLYYFGAVGHHDDKALADYVASKTGSSDLRQLSDKQLDLVLKSLMDWAAKMGVHWPQMADGREPGFGERRAVTLALWAECAKHGLAASPSESELIRHGRDLQLPQFAHAYRIADWDKLLRFIGMKLRTHIDGQDGALPSS